MPGQFNPANGQFRYSLETVPTVPLIQGATWHDTIFRNESISNQKDVRTDPSLYAGGQRPRSIPGKVHTNGDMEFSGQPMSLDRIYASMQGKVTTTTPGGATNARQHVLGPSQSTTVPSTHSSLIWRDDDLAQRSHGGQVSSAQFACSMEDGFLAVTLGMVYAMSDYWADGVEVAGTGAVIPTVRGIPPYALWTDTPTTDRKIHFKISDVTDIADGIIEILVKVGDGASYGAIPTTVNIGVNPLTNLAYWNVLLDSTSGLPIGSVISPVEVHFVNTTSLAVDDAWSFVDSRGVWTPDYPGTAVYNEARASILIDGVPYCIKDFTLTLTRPVTEVHCLGGSRAQEVRNRGQRAVEIEITRDYKDLSIRKKLETAETISFRADFYSGDIIEGATEYQMSLICPLIELSGPTASIQGQEEMDEVITGTCHPSDDVNFPDDLNILIISDETSLIT